MSSCEIVGGRRVVRGQCEWCGAPFERVCASRRDAEKARFCSRACNSRWMASRQAWRASRNAAQPEEMPLAAIRPRKHKRKGNAKLTQEQVRVLWRAYRAGWSMADLGRRIYYQRGYATPNAAREAIRLAFELEGFKRRGRSDWMRLMHSSRGCAGCGVHLDQRTPGCSRCRRRHWERQKKSGRVVEEAA